MGSRQESLSRISDAIREARIPLGILDLSDRCVLAINEAGAALFDRTPSELIGLDASAVWGDPDTTEGKLALAALAGGAIDGYRARRRIRSPSGVLDVWVWTRRIPLEGGPVALAVCAPVDDTDPTGHLIHAYFGPEAIDTSVHTGSPPETSSLPVSAALGAADGSADERLLDLERQILHIAAELHAVSDTRRGGASVESRRPALDALHPKPREIVDRLLRGERVSTIAEAMFLSPSTVRNHLSKVFKAFGVSTQASLLAALRSDAEEQPDD